MWQYSASRGCEINIKPKPLIVRKSDAPQQPQRRINADGESETMTCKYIRFEFHKTYRGPIKAPSRLAAQGRELQGC